MDFRPTVGVTLRIDQTNWRIAEHPSAPGMPYGQEGRAGVVFQLISGHGEKRALKVFRERFRVPSLVSLSQRLTAFSDLPGLEVCQRNVLTPANHRELLQKYPELIYAVWMPWVEGPTWMEIVLDISEGKRVLTKDQSLTLSHALVRSLTAMEQRGVAHGDLSGPNVILPGLSATFTGRTNAVALVDVEQMFAPGLEKPTSPPSGSSGYGHPQVSGEMWAAEADRFAGAILLAEMLGLFDTRIGQDAWGESYFEAGEMQTECQRYTVLYKALECNWGEKVSRLFARAWKSRDLKDCPTFGEWELALPALTVVPALGGDKLEKFFQQAQEAIHYQQWGKAKEILILILQESPDYRSQGVSARKMLKDVERKINPPPPLKWVWAVLGTMITLLIAIFLTILPNLPCCKESPTPTDTLQLTEENPIFIPNFTPNSIITSTPFYAPTIVSPQPFSISNYQNITPLHEWDVDNIIKIYGVALSPDSRKVALFTSRYPEEWWLEVRNSTDGELLWDVFVGKAAYNALAFSPDGNLVVTGTEEGDVRIWEVKNGDLLHTLEGHIFPVRYVVFSPDGTMIASGASDNTARVWQVSNGMNLSVYRIKTDVRDIAFSPDSQYLAVTSNNVNVYHISSRSDDPIVFSDNVGETRDLGEVAFSPNGKILIGGGEWLNPENNRWRYRILVWDFPNNQFAPLRIPLDDAVEDVVISPDEQVLVCVYKDKGKLLLIDIFDREIKGNIDIGPKLFMSYSPDVSKFAIISTKTTVTIWGFPDE